MRDLITMQQESIDSLLSMRAVDPHPSAPPVGVSDGGESSGYESAGGAGATAIDLRKLELQCQRLSQKMNGHVK